MTDRCLYCDSPSHRAQALGSCPGFSSAMSRRLTATTVEWLIFPDRGEKRVELVLEVGEAADQKIAHGESIVVTRETKRRDAPWPE